MALNVPGTPRHYDPNRVIVSVILPGFVLPKVTDFAPGSFVLVQEAEPTYTKIVGVDGQVSRKRSQRVDGRIVIELEEGSQWNEGLSAARFIDRFSANGIGVIGVMDLNGTTQAIGIGAWIDANPPLRRGSTTGSIPWSFECERLEYAHGRHFGLGETLRQRLFSLGGFSVV